MTIIIQHVKSLVFMPFNHSVVLGLIDQININNKNNMKGDRQKSD